VGGQVFEMEQIEGAARSAANFAAWLMRSYAAAGRPLRSLRLLLSPVMNEPIHADVLARLNGVRPAAAVRSNLETAWKGFRDACAKHTGNVGIVFVAGHGVQLSRLGSVLLLSDIGDDNHVNDLQGAADMISLHKSMNHVNTAQKQFWFVDACRQRPEIAERFETMEGAFKDSERRSTTAQLSPLFLSATTGKPAYVRPGGTTLFSEALMWALEGGITEGPAEGKCERWHVSVTSLIKVLPEKVKNAAAKENATQSVDIAGTVQEAVFHEYPDVPKVDLLVELLPDQAMGSCSGTLTDDDDTVVVDAAIDWPLRRRLEAGLYSLSVEAQAPYRRKSKALHLLPPSAAAKINVGP
jgi:hypothetical protein